MTTTEPEWDDETRQTVQALDLLDLSECPSCGLPQHVCQAITNQDGFTQPAPVRCHATTARLATQKNFTEESSPQVDALLWPTPVLRDGTATYG